MSDDTEQLIVQLEAKVDNFEKQMRKAAQTADTNFGSIEKRAKSVADNQILQVAVFAILFGMALALLSDEKKAPLLSLLTSLTDTMFQFTKLIMYFAPIAAGAAMAYTVGSMGLSTLLPLAKLIDLIHTKVNDLRNADMHDAALKTKPSQVIFCICYMAKNRMKKRPVV